MWPNEAEVFLSNIEGVKERAYSNIKFSYAKRIQRPSLRYINPYVEIEDPRDVTVGNPEVEPENTDQYEINYSTFVKGIVINSGVFYRHTSLGFFCHDERCYSLRGHSLHLENICISRIYIRSEFRWLLSERRN